METVGRRATYSFEENLVRRAYGNGKELLVLVSAQFLSSMTMDESVQS